MLSVVCLGECTVVLKRTVVGNKSFNNPSRIHLESHGDSCSGFRNVSHQQQFLAVEGIEESKSKIKIVIPKK